MGAYATGVFVNGSALCFGCAGDTRSRDYVFNTTRPGLRCAGCGALLCPEESKVTGASINVSTGKKGR